MGGNQLDRGSSGIDEPKPELAEGRGRVEGEDKLDKGDDLNEPNQENIVRARG